MSEKRFFGSAYGLKSSRETLAHYSDWAEVYDLEVGKELGYAQPKRCADALLALGIKPKARILDIGCGTGLSGLALKLARYSFIDGCDISPEMLQKAEEKKLYGRLFHADLNSPPLDIKDATYDAAAAVGVFSFGHVLPDAMVEILRLIKPGGQLVIGLNDHYYDEGDLPRKLEALEQAGTIEILTREHGDHLPAKGVMGWVIGIKKIA